jgi:hypothetical protein
LSDRDENRSTAAEDARTEAVVLRRLLDLHPSQVSLEELIRELGGAPEDFGQRDAVERAVRDLAAAGIVHRNAGFVFPTRAALRLDELLGED